ncbi:MAG TPA: hypothetical protein VFZ65_05170 [Planctomycetota bacterium]|nr:hypothetical protein [Planctomycetota bacterium]
MNRSLLPLLFTVPLAAQLQLPPPHVPVTPLAGDAQGLWAAGHDYKVRFADGVTFTPHVDADTPSLPFRWRTLGLFAADGQGLVAAPHGPEAHGYGCDIDLGFATERYDVRTEGLEQSFVFANPPQVRGDLRIVGAVDGALHAEARGAAHGPLVLRDPSGQVRARYGAAVAIDADGVRTPLMTSSDGGRIAIELPAALLANARYPLTVDPLLAPTTVLAWSYTDVRVAYTSANVQYPACIVTKLDWSTAETDLIVDAATADLSSFEFLHAIGAVNDHILDIDVVAANGGQNWVVAFTRQSANACFLHTRAVTDLGYDNNLVQLGQPAGATDRKPRLGGSLSGVAAGVLVVCERTLGGSTTVAGQIYDLQTHFVTTQFSFGAGLFTTAKAPSVSRDAGGLQWVVAWQSGSTLVPEYRIVAKRVTTGGTVSSASLLSDRSSLPVHEVAPLVDGRGAEFLLTYGERDQNTVSGLPADGMAQRVRSRRFSWGVLAAAPQALASQELVAMSQPVLLARDLAVDPATRSHWLSLVADTTTGELRSRMLGMTGRVLRTESVQGPIAPMTPGPAAVAYDPEHGWFQTVYVMLEPTYGDVWGRVVTHPNDAVSYYGAPACGSATAVVGGRWLRGNEFASLRLENAPGNQLALVGLSLGSGSLPLDSLGFTGCTLLVDLGAGWIEAIAAVTGAGGSAEIQVPLPESVPAADLFAQWLYFAPGSNAGGALTTYGLHLRIR